MGQAVIPEAALGQHIAILGKTGSGKTSTGKLAVEQVVATGARVCVIDPIKSDWWGLISSADGNKPGLPFRILGGPRGHVPLHDAAGKAIAEVVASGALPLSILDMADFQPGGQSKFFVDFAPALLRKMRGVLYLVIEESHMFAPKEKSGIGQENMATHWCKMLATAGRSKGIRLIVLTQRTQALHNAVLGSCDSMIAHRLTAPADQEPVIKWLKANAPKEVTTQVETSLGNLARGEGWLCSGEAQLFERRQFPRIHTYDNTRTPNAEDGEHHVKTAAVDADQLRAIIGEAVKEAEANDPKLLRKEIAELRRQLASKVPAVDQSAVDKAVSAALAARDREWKATIASHEKVIGDFRGRLTKIGQLAHVNGEATVLAPPVLVAAAKPVVHLPRAQPRAMVGDVQLSKAERQILAALYWLRDEDATPAKVGFYSDYSATSGGFNNALGKLRSSGLVQGWRITPEGASVAESLGTAAKPSGEELRHWLRRKLGKAENAILDALCEAHPQRMTAGALGEATGYSSNSGGFNNALGRLRSIEAAEGYERDGGTKAADVFFE